MTSPKLVSIELTNACSKGNQCRAFGCYAKSVPDGATYWDPKILGDFVSDLAANGIEAVSFGGGEPLEYPRLGTLLEAIRGVRVFKSMTTNGQRLTPVGATFLRPFIDKIHVSIHFPENWKEVTRVVMQVLGLEALGFKSGINFLVKGRNIEAEKKAVRYIRDAEIASDRVVFLPLRGPGIDVDHEVFKAVANILSPKFQSTWCLTECKKSDRFVSIDWEGKVGWCSYTPAKTRMRDFTHAGMMEALLSKELIYCG